jgi:phosphoglycerate dehydrogenase-like enzyme
LVIGFEDEFKLILNSILITIRRDWLSVFHHFLTLMNTPPHKFRSKVLMLLTSEFVNARYHALKEKAPDLEIVTELAPGPNEEIDVLFAFKLPDGLASRLPKLKMAASVGAGADGLLQAKDLPRAVRVTRAADPGLGFSMAQFVSAHILQHFRSFPLLAAQQRAGQWKRLVLPEADKVTVGIMGIGAIGSVVATALEGLGFRVVGWARSASTERKVHTFTGEQGLEGFLRASNYLVCLLPFTEQTRNLLDKEKLALLPKGAYLVNVARGGIVAEDDLVALIDSGHLAGATLDVFATEPLPAESPLWQHEKIVVTPHVAAQPSVEPVVAQFLENLRRLEAGETLINEVDRQIGY